MKLCRLKIILPLILTLSSSKKSFADKDENWCKAQEDCKSCIMMKGCAWCAVPVTAGKQPSYRCEDSATVKEDWCPSGYRVNPKFEQWIPNGYNKPLGKINENAIQMRPQKMELKMRVGESQTISFVYGVVEDYPVDLYYIMDLSKTMDRYKKKLSSLGDSLAKAMQSITENFKIGFGSFVDKVEMPFVSTVPKSLARPCNLSDGSACAPPYSFRNDMPLNMNTSLFKEKVAEAKVSGNLDNPEGGFDAIMQSIVCTEKIGWRETARRLLVYSSDAPFHFAGDGKLAGIVEPHDGQCHMENGLYTHDRILDYPSIGQINEKVKENHINLIFAIPEEQIQIYANLSKRIQGSSYGVLSDQSDRVVQLVKDQYNQLLELVEITNNHSEYIAIKYLTNCLQKDKPISEGNVCKGLKYEKDKSNVTFMANITVIKCPENETEWTQYLKIWPTGLHNGLIIKINIICDCECNDKLTSSPEFSDACNKNGRLECGICICNPSRSGKRCECEKSDSSVGDQSQCYSNKTGLLCSGAGVCKCGVCECIRRQDPSEIIHGKYCECDNYSCKRDSSGELCSGKDHGKCVCGSCKCVTGWTGEKCDCRETTESCSPKGGGPVCSDRGECVCGKCVCHSTSYEGQYCELCPICPGGACNELKSCVECQAYIKKDCQNCSVGLNLTIEETVTEESIRNEENTGFCRFPDENDCTFSFIYKKTEDGDIYFVTAEKEKRCSNVNILGVVLGVIGSIVLIGLLTLIIWKILTSIHDQREYSKFEKERAQAKFSRDDNPLYVKATSTYSNPTFGEN